MLEALGAAELLRGNPSTARSFLGRAWEIIRLSGAVEPNKAPFLTSARCRALLFAARGDPPLALATLDRSLRAHEGLADPFELGRTLLVLGGVRRRAKQKRAARDALVCIEDDREEREAHRRNVQALKPRVKGGRPQLRSRS